MPSSERDWLLKRLAEQLDITSRHSWRRSVGSRSVSCYAVWHFFEHEGISLRKPVSVTQPTARGASGRPRLGRDYLPMERAGRSGISAPPLACAIVSATTGDVCDLHRIQVVSPLKMRFVISTRIRLDEIGSRKTGNWKPSVLSHVSDSFPRLNLRNSTNHLSVALNVPAAPQRSV